MKDDPTRHHHLWSMKTILAMYRREMPTQPIGVLEERARNFTREINNLDYHTRYHALRFLEHESACGLKVVERLVEK
jgi:hypothetical protein